MNRGASTVQVRYQRDRKVFMPLSSLLKSAVGTCPLCHQKVGIISREHPECHRAHQAGWHEMVQLAAQAAGSPDFDESHLRLTMSAVAKISYGNQDTVNQALEEGWKLGVDHSMADGIITQDEEARLREFRDQLALGTNAADQSAMAQLDRASQERLMLDARLAAVAVFDGGAHLDDLTETLRQSHLSQEEQTMLLVQAWEAAVEGALEDGLFTLDEENALTRYINHFNLSQSELDAHGVHTSLIKAAILREIAEGVVPDRQHLSGHVPFNLMKSEKLVWVIEDVDYFETVVRRERRGSSHGLSIRIARGVYYPPSAFRSRAIEWEETVHQDTGLLGFTTKHIYFSGPKKKFRVRYDRIVDLEPYDDGFGIMKDNQTAKPQAFRTGDGWFAFNLAVNLGQME